MKCWKYDDLKRGERSLNEIKKWGGGRKDRISFQIIMQCYFGTKEKLDLSSTLNRERHIIIFSSPFVSHSISLPKWRGVESTAPNFKDRMAPPILSCNSALLGSLSYLQCLFIGASIEENMLHVKSNGCFSSFHFGKWQGIWAGLISKLDFSPSQKKNSREQQSWNPKVIWGCFFQCV